MAGAARALRDESGPRATFARAARLAVDHVRGCHSASLLVVDRDGVMASLDASDTSAVAGAELQQACLEGPCRDIVAGAATVRSPSLAYDDRWPTWGPRVVDETGLHSVLAFRVHADHKTIGALTMYSRDKDGFDQDDVDDGLVLSEHVAIAAATASQIDHLGLALASRTVIGQATGMLIERYKVTPDVAFDVLARIAAGRERKLRLVAEELVRVGTLAELDAVDVS